MLSFVLLQLEPLFRYDSREWSGESKTFGKVGGNAVKPANENFQGSSSNYY
ncbi:BQ5605_C032g11090 [Microbotryum silenes-dioicae]|uniref:BQ5605_C032g11090 protein n=1 Tax=Microbotryum silenes-dioicae TaxID=796604 RepID=A0A2X0ML47_9BASI|nr:BQ5605_C032g11090 [Microbotryum silenes-dioicae]